MNIAFLDSYRVSLSTGRPLKVPPNNSCQTNNTIKKRTEEYLLCLYDN